MTAPLQQGIARIRGAPGGSVAGTAFLVSRRHVVTCAHVVNNALGRAPGEAAQPTQPIVVEFPFSGERPGLTAVVAEWRPPGDGVTADIAVLELGEDVRIRPLRTAAAPPRRGREFWTVGFPEGQDRGVEAEGDLRAPTEFGRLMARAGARSGGFFIEGGFSGAPLIDVGSGVVLGMAVEATYDPARRTAFVIPVEQLEHAWPPLARPYRGLGSFQEADARFFFGRERYVEELAAKLAGKSLVAVVGRSGSGKSSLVRAGLVPRLRAEDDWCVVTFRPGAPADDPFDNLAAALLEETDGPVRDAADAVDRQQKAEDMATRLRGRPEGIVPLLRAISDAPGRPEPRKVLLVADQFEELFTIVQDRVVGGPGRSTRAEFVRCLLCATDTGRGAPAASCVLTLRADYVGLALGLRELADALRDADVKLGPMIRDELREAIERPAAELGVRFESGLADELVSEIGDRADALPLLEFALSNLWTNQTGRLLRRPETTAGKTNPLTEPLERHAEEVFRSAIAEFGEDLFRQTMVKLVWLADPSRGGEDTRRVRRRSEFDERGWRLVELLSSQDRQARLVTTGSVRATSEPTAEIVHEALIRGWPRLRKWLDEDRAFRVWLQRTEEAAAEWRRTRDPSDLLTGRRLAEAEGWSREGAAAHLITVSDFMAASVERRKAEDDEKAAAAATYTRALEEKAKAEARAATEAKARETEAKAAAAEADRLRLTAEGERDAAEAAKRQADKARQGLRKALIGAVVLLVLVAGSAGVAVFFWQSTQSALQTAQVQTEIAERQKRLSSFAAGAMSRVSVSASPKAIELSEHARNAVASGSIDEEILALISFALYHNESDDRLRANEIITEVDRLLSQISDQSIFMRYYEALGDITWSEPDGKFLSSIRYYEMAHQIASNNQSVCSDCVRLLRKLAAALVAAGNFGRAEEKLHSAKAVASDDQTSLEAGMLLWVTGQFNAANHRQSEALQYFEQAVNLIGRSLQENSDRTAVNLALGQIFQQMGDLLQKNDNNRAYEAYNQAILALEKALASHPTLRDALRSIEIARHGLRLIATAEQYESSIRQLSEDRRLLFDSRFGQGLGIFRFGMSVREVNQLFDPPFNQRLNESELLWRAWEYKTSNVGYFCRWLGTIPPAQVGCGAGIRATELTTNVNSWSNCVANVGYVVFMFSEGKLFRIVLRFFKDGSKCPEINQAVDEFAQEFGIEIAVSGGERRLRYETSRVGLSAHSTSSLVAFDFVQR